MERGLKHQIPRVKETVEAHAKTPPNLHRKNQDENRLK